MNEHLNQLSRDFVEIVEVGPRDGLQMKSARSALSNVKI